MSRHGTRMLNPSRMTLGAFALGRLSQSIRAWSALLTRIYSKRAICCFNVSPALASRLGRVAGLGDAGELDETSMPPFTLIGSRLGVSNG